MEKNITGLMVYYYFVCQRKLWYFTHQINLEDQSELVQIGKQVDEHTYSREKKHLEIDQVINLDYIDSQHVLHEVKKSRAIEEASVWQLKYYLFYLKNHGVNGISGRIDYPLLRKQVDVELTNNDEEDLQTVLDKIKLINQASVVPILEEKSICKKCAYHDLCFI
ncbi:CRISPR-associated protein Cas4 [Oscillospiraceae bacterium HV4-5-C5C]|nr:CRISPR-associated protein Cas4 [Oscillospiraceae bacterium HV4-5-C5C]